jgi:hypothetical protein
VKKLYLKVEAIFFTQLMSFFNASEPLIRRKQEALDLQDLQGLLRLRWRVGPVNLFSLLYTRIDQVFVVWG